MKPSKQVTAGFGLKPKRKFQSQKKNEIGSRFLP
jgi:hypothetical protein